MMNPLSHRISFIKPSPTLAVAAKANALKAAGKDIIGLGTGEPDFDTPQFIKDAANAAIAKGMTKYTAVGGTPSLKKAIIDKFRRDQQLDYALNQVTVSNGGKQSIFNLIMATINPSDEVIIPTPYWVSYPDIVLLAEGKTVFAKADIEQHFKITAHQLKTLITPQTRMLLLNSPSNPTGSMYSAQELKEIGEVLLEYPKIIIGTDDIYEHIMLGDKAFINILQVCPELSDRTVIINGVSKAYSMTGWRIGYAAGPTQIIQAMENLQSQSTSNACSISQAAAEAAITGDQSCMQPMLKAFRERHEMVTQRLNALPGISCMKAQGAFYVFPDCQKAIKTLFDEGTITEHSDIAFSTYLLKNGVAVVPGSAFGMNGYMRISFATSTDNLQKALNRIENALQ